MVRGERDKYDHRMDCHKHFLGIRFNRFTDSLWGYLFHNFVHDRKDAIEWVFCRTEILKKKYRQVFYK